MAFELTTVTDFIAGLVIVGYMPDGSARAVTVLDIDEIMDTADPRQCPILQPDITRQLTMTTFSRDSFGAGAIAKQTMTYTLPYTLLYAPVGSERNLTKILFNLARTLSAIVTAFIANDTPSSVSVDLQVAGITFGQTVNDPAGRLFHGASIDVLVQEFVN